MHYSAVVDQVGHASPLDPLSVLGFALVFLGVAHLTARRPVYGLACLIASIPFALYRDILGTTLTLPKVVLLGVILGLFTYVGVLRELRARPASALLSAGGLVFAATAISIAQASVWEPAVRETLKVVEYLAIFASAFLCFRLDPDEHILRWAIAATTGVVALLALGQEIVGSPSGLLLNNVAIPRIAGPLEGPNQLAGYLEISIAILGGLTCVRRTREVAVALALVAFADVLTFSRAGLMGAVVAIVVLAIVYRRSAMAMVAPLGCGLALGVLVTGLWDQVAHTLDLFRFSRAGSSYTGGVGTRSELWRAAIQLWRQHPLLGVGAGNFELDLPRVGLTTIRTHANSLYLQTLVEGGLPLFLATLALLTTAIVSFARGAARSPFCAGALAATIALSAHQFFDLLVFYPKVGDWWWAILGMGAAALANARTPCD
ncbi:MAG TPA: O-antigen ligase family protein [Verrucomicrobiae bacterium]|jgi:O-antigen ligase|nr:O-antigen ligase family protein [Verrucomicrobiae bacterium]